jgi:hypothetical protein
MCEGMGYAKCIKKTLTETQYIVRKIHSHHGSCMGDFADDKAIWVKDFGYTYWNAITNSTVLHCTASA